MIRALSYLCVFSIILAISLKFILVRQFQSDEFLIATSINLLNFPKEFQFIHILNFYMIPFSFFTNLFDNTQSILYFMRISFFGIFLLNIYLLSRFVKLSFLKNLILFIIVLTHYQLWRFGFEIRHETLIVLFIILTSLFIKKYLQTSERKHIFWVGAFLSLLSFTAYKGFIYSIAMGGTFFLIEMIRKNKKSIRPLTFFLASYIIVSLLQMFLFYYFGHLPTFLKIMNNYVNETDTSMLFSPIGIYLDIIKSSPITVLTFIIGVYFFIKKKEFYNFKGWAILNVINITILLHLNPAPFRYNIHTYLIVILIAVLALYDELPKVKKYLYIPLISIHLSLFLYFFISDYYMNYRNDHQLEYVKHAESLTTKDEPVFDLIGLIATRNQIHPHWWLYNAKMKNYYTGKLTYVADMIKQKWPPVIITNYRWPWLRKEDLKTLSEHYVRLHDQFWVLGRTTKQKTGSFIIQRPGNYYLFSESKKLKISGLNFQNNTALLKTGKYEFTSNNTAFTIFWLGEKLSEPPNFVHHLNGPWMITPRN